MKLKYFQGKLVYFKEKYEVIWRPCPAVSRYNSHLLLCMDNNLDHSFECKLLSTGRKLQLTLGPIKQGWQTSIEKEMMYE